MSDIEKFRESKATWVIKIGSGVLFKENDLDENAFLELIETIITLRKTGRKIILVSSGAVAFGRQILHEKNRPSSLAHLQALAAVGQPRLIQLYKNAFREQGIIVAQVLFGRDDLHDRRRYLNAEETIQALLEADVLPIINENDTVSTDELRFGDNDELGAMTCGLVSADVFVIYSVADGIRDVINGKLASVISTIESEDERLEKLALPTKSSTGRGGMQTKISACKLAARFDVQTVITSGKSAKSIFQLTELKEQNPNLSFVGTHVIPEGDAVRGPKIWLTAAARVAGRITCDAGAKNAILHTGSSLLPAGVLTVEGGFQRGEVVELISEDAHRFARGIAIYNSEEIEKICGVQSSKIFDILGYRISDTIIHRDSLVIE